MRSYFLFIAASLLVTACAATPFKTDEIKPSARVYTFLDQNKLTNNVSVGTITLSDDLPTHGEVITEGSFKDALQQSLKQAGWYKADKANYTLSAHLQDYDRPFSLTNVKVFSTIDYTLNDTKTGQTAYHETIKMPCVKSYNAFVGALLSNNSELPAKILEAQKCAISENLTQLLQTLNNQF